MNRRFSDWSFFSFNLFFLFLLSKEIGCWNTSLEAKEKSLSLIFVGPISSSSSLAYQNPCVTLQAAFVRPIKLDPFLLAALKSFRGLLTDEDLGEQTTLTSSALLPLLFSSLHKFLASFPRVVVALLPRISILECVLFFFLRRKGGWPVGK